VVETRDEKPPNFTKTKVDHLMAAISLGLGKKM
jgi:hypothetical protein